MLTRYPPLIPVLVGAVASAVLTLIILRRPTRPPGLSPQHLLAVACIAAASDTFLLATAGAHATQQPGGTLGPVTVLAANASIIRLALAPRAARQALRRTPDLSHG